MTKFGDIPSSVCKSIAMDAASIAYRYAKRRGWSSAGQIRAVWGKNRIGLSVGEAYWLNFQNRGTHPFIPWGLAGKTVPFQNSGRVNFVTARGLGLPGFVHIPQSYLDDPRRRASSKNYTNGDGAEIYVENGQYGRMIWREAKWANPGIKPTYFINKALREAVEMNLPKIKKYKPAFRLNRNVRDDTLSLE